MTSQKPKIANSRDHLSEARRRLSTLKVLVADHDRRTASLVQRILFSFGFRAMDVTTDGQEVISLLRQQSYDLVILEWNLKPISGITLVKAIRAMQSVSGFRRDIPILMLTARADVESVRAARDAGITEFVAKPFSANTISHRIIQIIDNPRAFVETPEFVGPDRRRRTDALGGSENRRRYAKAPAIPANTALKSQLGDLKASEIFNESAVAQAQAHLMQAENDFLSWAKEDIFRLQHAFAIIQKAPDDAMAKSMLMDAAYAIKSQAGVFGYGLGTEVAALLVNYLATHEQFVPNNLLVMEKHIETMSVIFRQKIKESGQGIAMDMLLSLKKLIEKLG